MDDLKCVVIDVDRKGAAAGVVLLVVVFCRAVVVVNKGKFENEFS
uniref:Uncharacterized protein n=1 Tax=Rhizophora mucronata TaxID=61149 RepID=A0A2P2ITB1_RHIMU